MTRDDKIDLMGRLLATHDLPLKGAKNKYSAINGNMFCFVDPEGVFCIRLSKDDLAAFNAEFGTGPVLQYGAVMRGYTELPEAVLRDDALTADWFTKSVAHGRALKPKPTQK